MIRMISADAAITAARFLNRKSPVEAIFFEKNFWLFFSFTTIHLRSGESMAVEGYGLDCCFINGDYVAW